MANTATVYARIDPELKTEAESILSQLGVTPSAAVQMLYNQIRLTKGIPFEVRLPVNKPVFIDELSREQLSAELQKGYDSINAGRMHSSEEVESILKEKYGI